MKINLNDQVKVRLNEKGRQILKNTHDRLNKDSNGFLGEYKPEAEDENGYTKFTLWVLMNEFGEHLTHGFDAPFDTNIVLEGKE